MMLHIREIINDQYEKALIAENGETVGFLEKSEDGILIATMYQESQTSNETTIDGWEWEDSYPSLASCKFWQSTDGLIIKNGPKTSSEFPFSNWKKMNVKSKRGGHRPGAGRPPLPPDQKRQKVSLTLAPGIKELAQQIAKNQGLQGPGYLISQLVTQEAKRLQIKIK